MAELQFARIGLALVASVLGCTDLVSEPSPSASASQPTRSARAVVAAWQEGALGLEESSPEALLGAVATPFSFVAPDVAGFRAATVDDVRRELSIRERLAVVHSAARVVRAAGAEPRWETPRRGEIVATLGDDRGYALTLRHGAEGWRIVRFEIRTAPRP